MSTSIVIIMYEYCNAGLKQTKLDATCPLSRRDLKVHCASAVALVPQHRPGCFGGLCVVDDFQSDEVTGSFGVRPKWPRSCIMPYSANGVTEP